MASAAKPIPADVRLMNAVANTVFVLAGVALLAAALLALTRLPYFGFKVIRLDGELTRSSVATIRANAAPRLAGNFWNADLGAVREAFESVPWVRRAIVKRMWPDRLAITLEEHHTAALWVGDDGNDRLVNSHGEVFEANLGDVEEDALPRFSGPDGSAAQMLAVYGRLKPLFERMDAGIEGLRLSRRSSWRVELDTGAVIELGRGSDDEVLVRCERFVRTLAQVNDRFQRPLEYADLRHADGYAVRLKGITTTVPVTGKRKN
jgi:cell division protein FtsQ